MKQFLKECLILDLNQSEMALGKLCYVNLAVLYFVLVLENYHT